MASAEVVHSRNVSREDDGLTRLGPDTDASRGSEDASNPPRSLPETMKRPRREYEAKKAEDKVIDVEGVEASVEKANTSSDESSSSVDSDNRCGAEDCEEKCDECPCGKAMLNYCEQHKEEDKDDHCDACLNEATLCDACEKNIYKYEDRISCTPFALRIPKRVRMELTTGSKFRKAKVLFNVCTVCQESDATGI